MRYLVALLALLSIALTASAQPLNIQSSGGAGSYSIYNDIDPANSGSFVAPYLWQDLKVPLNSTKVNGPDQPLFDNFMGTAIGAYQFSGTAASEVFFTAQLPHGIDRSTPMDCHVHYSPSATIGAATVTFGLEYLLTGTMAVIATQTTTIQASKSNIVSGTHHLLQLGTIAIPSTGADSAVLIGRFFRPSAGTDTSNTMCYVFDIDFHFKVSKIGSSGQYGD